MITTYLERTIKGLVKWDLTHFSMPSCTKVSPQNMESYGAITPHPTPPKKKEKKKAY